MNERQAQTRDAECCPDGVRPPRGGWRIVRGVLRLTLLAALLSVPWWGPRALRQLAFFRVRAVEVVGARYFDPSEVVRLLAVDTLRSVWDELAPLERRVAVHPQLSSVRIERRLPGTLVVHVTERQPVAFAPTPGGLQAFDAAGHALPIDPTRTPVDLPVVATADSALLAVLGALRDDEPALYRRVSQAQRVDDDELLFRMLETAVRTSDHVTAARLAEIRPVEVDLRRRQLHAAELDLRFRNQVIARLP